jgi:hypothetical protein
MNKKLKQAGGAIEKAILYNKYVLYFIFLVALGYLIILLMLNDFYTFFIFILIGFLTSFFSKNMVVILSLAMSVSFILKYGTNIRQEGFQEGVMDASGNMLDASGNKIPATSNESTTDNSTDNSGNSAVSGNQNPTPTLSSEESGDLLKSLTNTLAQQNN